MATGGDQARLCPEWRIYGRIYDNTMADSVHRLFCRAILEDLQAGGVEARPVAAHADPGRCGASSMGYCLCKMAHLARRGKGLMDERSSAFAAVNASDGAKQVREQCCSIQFSRKADLYFH